MRPLRACALGLVVIGCSNNSSDATEPAKPEGAVAIYLQGVGELPKLEMRVAFAHGVDPGPHIEPLASAIVEARKTCFTKDSPIGFVCALHLDIKGGVVAAKATNKEGKCIAAALDQQPIKDKVDASVEMQVTVAPR